MTEQSIYEIEEDIDTHNFPERYSGNGYSNRLDLQYRANSQRTLYYKKCAPFKNMKEKLLKVNPVSSIQ